MMLKIYWGITAIGSIFGGAMFVLSLLTAQGAPQEAAGSAIAMALAVIPYVFARAMEEGAKPRAKVV